MVLHQSICKFFSFTGAAPHDNNNPCHLWPGELSSVICFDYSRCRRLVGGFLFFSTRQVSFTAFGVVGCIFDSTFHTRIRLDNSRTSYSRNCPQIVDKEVKSGISITQNCAIV